VYPNECRAVCEIRVSEGNIGVSMVADVMLVYPVELVDEELEVAEDAVQEGGVGECKVVGIVLSVDCLQPSAQWIHNNSLIASN